MAADQGNVLGKYSNGVIYATGDGVPQDYKEAVKWYRLATDQGDARSQLNLGMMYANGKGVRQSSIIAYALYNLSETGDPSSSNEAISNSAALTRSMSNFEIEADQVLNRELSKSNNLLKTLGMDAKKPAVKEKTKTKPAPN